MAVVEQQQQQLVKPVPTDWINKILLSQHRCYGKEVLEDILFERHFA